MHTDEQIVISDKVLKISFLCTLLLLGVPFSLYLWGRISGELPSEAVWNSRGSNHGPWCWHWQGNLIMLSMVGMVALSGLTFLFGVSMSLVCKQQKLLLFAKATALSILQIVLLFSILLVVFWTTD